MQDAPRYRCVSEDLRRRIASGEFPPGSRLPSWRILADYYRVGLGVIEEAFGLLRQGGEIVSTQRTGVHVADPAKVQILTDPDMPWPHARGDTQTATLPAGRETAALLGIETGDSVLRERVEYLDENGRPSHLRAVYRRPGTERQASRTVRARVSGRILAPDEAEHLGLAASLALVVRSVRVDREGRPAEVVELVLPADRWQVALGS